jgi:hypothetical protein
MKRLIFAAAFALAAISAWGQQTVVVAVAPFEAKSGASVEDADTITEIYTIRLAAARRQASRPGERPCGGSEE